MCSIVVAVSFRQIGHTYRNYGNSRKMVHPIFRLIRKCHVPSLLKCGLCSVIYSRNDPLVVLSTPRPHATSNVIELCYSLYKFLRYSAKKIKNMNSLLEVLLK